MAAVSKEMALGALILSSELKLREGTGHSGVRCEDLSLKIKEHDRTQNQKKDHAGRSRSQDARLG